MELGVYQAKTHLPELINRIEMGEEITITRHGKAVARLLSVAPPKTLDVAGAINELRTFGARRSAGAPLSDLIAEGRR